MSMMRRRPPSTKEKTGIVVKLMHRLWPQGRLTDERVRLIRRDAEIRMCMAEDTNRGYREET